MLHRAINYIIEHFGYFLVFRSINNYYSIYYRTHQNVTKTRNKVVNSSMEHTMSMAYVRIYTQQSIFFHKVSSDHQNDNFEAFSRLWMLLIAAKTYTTSCQAWIFVIVRNVAPAHSSIQYRQIFCYHFDKRDPQLPTSMKISWKYLYGGTFEKCKHIKTHCSASDHIRRTHTIILLVPVSKNDYKLRNYDSPCQISRASHVRLSYFRSREEILAALF